MDSDFTFELVPFENEAQGGTRGTIGPYGDAQAFFVKPTRPTQASEIFRSELVSEHLPETYFAGVGMGGQPSLTKGRMRVGETKVEVSYNSRGISRVSRALHLRYEDRAYTYEVKKGSAVELSRAGARVGLKNGKHLPPVGFHRLGSTKGAVDEVDLAIALVLEAVEIASLTLGGAIAISPFRLLSSGDGSGE
jgi:hypothetical protein